MDETPVQPVSVYLPYVGHLADGGRILVQIMASGPVSLRYVHVAFDDVTGRWGPPVHCELAP